jgi:hypothetical protein
MGFSANRCEMPKQSERPQLIPFVSSPATVAVRGHFRDGHYVFPHSRRPPGVAERDLGTNLAIANENNRRMEPYRERIAKAKRTGWFVFFVALAGLWGLSATMRRNRERYAAR